MPTTPTKATALDPAIRRYRQERDARQRQRRYAAQLAEAKAAYDRLTALTAPNPGRKPKAQATTRGSAA